MNISELSIKRPVFAWMLMAALILFGAISFQKMGVSQLPDVDFPVVSVSLTYEGAAPEVMETDIVDVVEDAVMTVQGVRSVSSYSRYGSASVAIEFELSRNIDAALQEVQTKVAQAQRNLPQDMDVPVISKTNPEDQPIMWLTVSSDKHEKKYLMSYVRDQLKDKFTTVSGVGEVFLGGYVDPNLRIWTSDKDLRKYELTIGDILDAVKNEHSELPAGQIETGRREFDVRTMGEARSIEEFGNIIINSRGGRPNFSPIYLKQVAKVEDGLAEIRRVSRFNGKPALGLGVKKQRGTNAVEVAKAVKARMAELQPVLPEGMEISVNFDTTKFIEDSVHELNFTLILAAILTSLVCWLFLGSLSSTINILLAIPTSIIGAFTILYFFGFTLNTFTLLGLSLAVGIVVDDAIMVLENIVRHREMGKTRVQAALDGSKEITFAAMAATIAIVAIFLPVAFMRGVIGVFFLQFGVTMTVTVLLSLLEAVTLTPMRCAEFVDTSHGSSKFNRGVDALFLRISNGYRNLLAGALHHRWAVVCASLLVFALSLTSFKFLNKEFVPSQDQSIFLVKLETPVDSALAYTDSKFVEAEKILMARPEVERIYVAVGGFDGGKVNSGNIFVSMKELGKRGQDPLTGREPTQQDFMETTRAELKKIPDVKVFIQDLSMRGFTASRGFPVEFSVRGADWSKLAEYSGQIKDELAKTGLVTDLDMDYKLGKSEIQIFPDREKAARFGVSILSISEAVRALIGGVVAGKYEVDGHRNDIRVRLVPEERERADQIKNLWIRNNRGEVVRLSEVVRLEERQSLQQISRFDRERAVTVFANIQPGQSQQKALEAVTTIAQKILPSDYRIVLSGSTQTFKESFRDLIIALILGILVSYMVLAAQFNSFVDPISVLMALPFSISGAFLALLLAGLSLNVYSFIGIILLMGIVKKNSILLVEFTNQIRERGEANIHRALLEACPIRLRPIVMTSLATIAGALPAALAIGPGAETRVPMAVAVIGGVFLSTLLTLFVVPCVYSLLGYFRKQKPLEVDFAAVARFFVVGILFSSVVSAAETQESLSIRRAIELGIQKNPGIQESLEKLNEAQDISYLAISKSLPKVDGMLTWKRKKDAVNAGSVRFGGDSYNDYLAEINASQALLKRGFMSALFAGGQEKSIRQMDLEIAKRDLTFNIVQVFYKVLLYSKQHATLKKAEELHRQSLATAQHRLKIGRGQLLDVLQVKTQLALLAPRIEKSQNDTKAAAAELSNYLGERELRQIEVVGELHPISLKDLRQKTQELKTYVPELVRFESLQDQFQNTMTMNLGKHWPQLDLVGGVGRAGPKKSDLTDSDSNFWSVGVQLNVPLFSGLSYFFEKGSLESQALQLRYQDQQLRNDFSLSQVKSLQDLRSAESVIDSSKVAFDLAEQSVKEAKRQFKIANIDYVALLTTEQNMLDAELSFDQAKYDYIGLLTKYFIANGYPPELLIDSLGG